jgi:hypothetical protein
MSDWLFNGKPFTSEMIENNFGFVYRIDCLENGKSYIGRKYFTRKRKKTKKDRRRTVESDWQNYWSSSEKVKADVEKYGEEKFRRTILCLCKTKGSTNFMEVKLMFEMKVLESDSWYNDNILGRYFSERTQKYLKEQITPGV